MIAIDAAGEQVHHHEAAEISPLHFKLKAGILAAGFEVFRGIAKQNRRLGHDPADRADAAINRLHNPAQDRHVPAPLAAVRRPEAKVAAEERADQRLIEWAPNLYAVAITADDCFGELLQRLGEFRIAYRLLEPHRRAEVHHVQEEIDPLLLDLLHPLIGVGPVELPALRLKHVPGERITKIGKPQLLTRAAEIFFPEAIVLRPLELIDVEMRQERAFDAGSPHELLEGKS